MPKHTAPEDKESFLQLVASGKGLRAAAAELGYANGVWHRWQEDQEYAQRLEDARIQGVGEIERRLDDRILRKLEQEGDLPGAETNLIMFRLKHHDPTYREASPGVHFHTKVEYSQLDPADVRKVLQEAGAIELEESDVKELPEGS